MIGCDSVGTIRRSEQKPVPRPGRAPTSYVLSHHLESAFPDTINYLVINDFLAFGSAKSARLSEGMTLSTPLPRLTDQRLGDANGEVCVSVPPALTPLCLASAS